MIVSIHQPNYLPWLGFFDKMNRSEIFVIMDDVQFPRGKNHFGHRNKIKTNNGDKWLTVPVKNRSDLLPFNEIEINYETDWIDQHLSLIEHFYRKAPFYSKYIGEYRRLYEQKSTTLLQLNMSIIYAAMIHLGIYCDIEFSSELASNEVGFDRIMSILEKTDATVYISGTGPGSLRYIDEDVFKYKEIQLEWQHYNHSTYTQQFGDFLPNMCFLDLLFNVGPDAGEFL